MGAQAAGETEPLPLASYVDRRNEVTLYCWFVWPPSLDALFPLALSSKPMQAGHLLSREHALRPNTSTIDRHQATCVLARRDMRRGVAAIICVS
eukprot:6177959-Pleurochrysis_carterae.AAC.2